MAQQKEPTDTDIANIKKSLVGAGILKAVSLSKADEAKLAEELARHGLDAQRRNWRLICSKAHWCLVIAK
jgi:hypothetical protein